MKKFIYSAVAAGALAFGGAASAQDPLGVLGTILGNIGLGGTTGVYPGVVAQGQGQLHIDQYGRTFYYDQYGRQVYVGSDSSYGSNVYGGTTVYGTPGVYGRADQFGTYVDAYGVRRMVDAYGRHLRLDQYGSYRDQYGRTVYLGADRRPLYIEQNGQIYSASSVNTAIASRRDRDGDGVRNRDDRYPDDPRYR